jgi:arabinose-5-phosphate isomerase
MSIETLRPKSAAAAGDLAAARRVLSYAGDALAQLSAQLDASFSRAIDLLAAVQGRVVVSGMGKSGHVGHKIAATLSSTGTPAQFVHPAEASHGDLGMLTRDDALLMLSNSGETDELANVIDYAKRFSIPLIGMASDAKSTLLQAADVALVLPRSQEACPMGLAPTTSTTLMLAMGDALAVALMERKGFTADHYRELHPGGSLGRRLIRVSDIMHGKDELPLVNPSASMKDVIAAMTPRHGFAGVTGVVGDDGGLVGVITDGDLRRHMEEGLRDRTARDVMSKKPKIIAGATLAVEALAIMNGSRITSLFVVEPGDAPKRPVGLLHIHDCLRAGIR